MPLSTLPPAARPAPPAADRLARIRRIVRLLDTAVGIPGTRFRFGLDPLLGLVPGLGDAVGAILSGTVIIEAARAGASPAVLLRMVGNLLVDELVGTVPFIGDLFDFGWKANTRNLAILEEHLADSAAVRTETTRIALGLALVLATALALAIAGIWWLAAAIIQRVGW